MRKLLAALVVCGACSVADAGSFSILTPDGNLIYGNSNPYGGSAFNSFTGGITVWNGQLPMLPQQTFGYAPAYGYQQSYYAPVYRPYGYYQTPRFGRRW